MSEYVIGVASSLNDTEMYAVTLEGKTLASVQGGSICFITVNNSLLNKRFEQMIEKLLEKFDGRKEDCRCLLVSASGIDSPRSHQVFLEVCQSPGLCCPIFCINDGVTALYITTKGEGVLTIADKGTICVGRNHEGQITRSGGYPVTVLGNEGSAQWIALAVLHLASQWLDGSVENSLLIEQLHEHFGRLDLEKLLESANALRRKTIDAGLARIVIQCAEQGDPAAIQILKQGARDLFAVAKTVVRKLGMENMPFLSGLYGYIFRESKVFRKEYCRLYKRAYPACRFMESHGSNAENVARMALDYLNGQIPYIDTL